MSTEEKPPETDFEPPAKKAKIDENKNDEEKVVTNGGSSVAMETSTEDGQQSAGDNESSINEEDASKKEEVTEDVKTTGDAAEPTPSAPLPPSNDKNKETKTTEKDAADEKAEEPKSNDQASLEASSKDVDNTETKPDEKQSSTSEGQKSETTKVEEQTDEGKKEKPNDSEGGKTEETSAPAGPSKVDDSNDSNDSKKESGGTGGDSELSGMDWQDGVATLEGSDMKFKYNEFGMLELITDDSEAASGDSANKPAAVSAGGDASKTSIDTKPDSSTKTCVCETCGKTGPAMDFGRNGRFCSQMCATKQSAALKSKDGKKTPELPSAAKSKDGKKTPELPSAAGDAGQDRTGAISPSGRKRKMGYGKAHLHGDLKMTININKTTKQGQQQQTPDEVATGDNIPQPKTPSGKGKGKKKGFNWAKYVEEQNAISAPIRHFKDPFPTSRNGFRVGMRLEGIDPKHPSLYCVLTVAEVRGYRVRLHFDGYSECYDFWVNADSLDIQPAGWCEKTNHKLQPPKGFTTENFSWTSYLKMTKSQMAPKHLFKNYENEMGPPQGFKRGMKLEAVDKWNPSLTCVATVTDIMESRFLIHFDAWDDTYDYWCDSSSNYIHPVGWCEENSKVLSPPNDYPDIANFTWADYLSKTKATAVPTRAFKQRPPAGFQPYMKLEVVDKRNPSLIRVATIVDVEGHRIKINFDGWADLYDYWLDDDSPDIHPAGWCAKTGHPLTPPITPYDLQSNTSGQPGCPTPGCNGVGHIKGTKYTGHHSSFGCPYSPLNMNKDNVLQDRLGYVPKGDGKKSPLTSSPEQKRCPTPGCTGAGHITGKYTQHYKLSGCPLYEKNIAMMNKSPTVKNRGRPSLAAQGGRGRKKHKGSLLVPGKKKSHKDKESSPNNLHKQLHQSVFMSAMSPCPAKDLPLCWEQHSKLLPGVANLSYSTVAKWTMDEVAEFVKKLPGCQDHANKFSDEQIDGEAFLLLTQIDIVKIMSIKLGPALKIYNAILILKSSAEETAAAS